MQRFARYFALSLLAAALARADSTLVHAQQAQARLGAEFWSTLIEIENSNPRSRYPARLHALVFELADVLWFYTSVDGTQSFSLHRGRLAEEKADFAPLLREIEPGFTTWRSVAAEKSPTPPVERATLPNGCFIESVAEWRAHVATGAMVRAPQLLSYYADTPAGRRGHTVLTFQTDRGVTVIDATVKRTQRFSLKLSADPLKLARAVLRAPVAKARWVPLASPVATAASHYIADAAASDGEAPRDVS